MKPKPCPFCDSDVNIVRPSIILFDLFYSHLIDNKDYKKDYKVYVKCTNCDAMISGTNEEEVIKKWNKRTVDIPLLQYKNLRKYFQNLINEVLGKNYYNEGMDVYSCDEYTCRDLSAKLKKKTLFIWK